MSVLILKNLWIHHSLVLRHTKQYTQETNDFQEYNYYVTVHMNVISPWVKFGTCNFTTWMGVQMFEKCVLMFRSISFFNILYILILHDSFLSDTLKVIDNIPSQ